MKKYQLYTGDLKDLTRDVRFSHYENGNKRLLIYVSKLPAGEWRKLTDNEIKTLSPHEKQWYNAARNTINAEYISKPKFQQTLMNRFSNMLDVYEKNLKIEKEKLAKGKENAES